MASRLLILIVTISLVGCAGLRIKKKSGCPELPVLTLPHLYNIEVSYIDLDGNYVITPAMWDQNGENMAALLNHIGNYEGVIQSYNEER